MMTDGIGGSKTPSVNHDIPNRDRTHGWVSPYGYHVPGRSSPKKSSVRSLTGIEMSSSTEEGGQDYDDILGFPGDGFTGHG